MHHDCIVTLRNAFRARKNVVNASEIHGTPPKTTRNSAVLSVLELFVLLSFSLDSEYHRHVAPEKTSKKHQACTRLG